MTVADEAGRTYYYYLYFTHKYRVDGVTGRLLHYKICERCGVGENWAGQGEKTTMEGHETDLLNHIKDMH